MSNAEVTNFFGEAKPASETSIADPLRGLALYAIVGALQVAANFPKLLKTMIQGHVGSDHLRAILIAAVNAVQGGLQLVIGRHGAQFFERAMTCAFLLFWLLLALLLILSLRRGGYRALFCGAGGILVGYLTIHGLSWAAVIIVKAIGGVLFLLRWAGAVITAIFSFLTQPPIPLIIGLLTLAWIAFLLAMQAVGFARWLLKILRTYLVPILAVLLIATTAGLVTPFVWRWIVRPLWRFLVAVIKPVALFVYGVLKWLVLTFIAIVATLICAVLVFLALALIGSLLISQIQAAWHAGRSLRLLLGAGFAIGSALAMLVLACIATPALAESLNVAMFNPLALFGAVDHTRPILTDLFLTTLPTPTRAFAFAHLTNLAAPTFDGFVFLIVMALATSSVFFRLLSMRPVDAEAVPLTFMGVEYITMVGGLLVALVLFFAQAYSGDSSA